VVKEKSIRDPLRTFPTLPKWTTTATIPRLEPTRAWRILRFVNGSIAFGAAIVFLLAGREAVSLFIGLGQMMELEIDIPIWWMYLAFPVGFAMMAFFALEELLDAGRDLLRHPPEGTA